jgi:phage N-6-adenine-methyltransferase
MTINPALFSSNSEEWSTPQGLLDELDKEFHFELDAAATVENAKCKKFWTKEDDGLKQSWAISTKNSVWLNPPYSRNLDQWIHKAHTYANTYNIKTVMLLPARTDTAWFHDFIYNQYEIRFIRGRLKFGNSKNSAPFPSMLVIFDGKSPLC